MKATDTFRHPFYRHNCAQAIANHWKVCYDDENIVETYVPYVAGRAPDGLCGALYAAIQACPNHSEEIISEFTKVTGAMRCREIKQLNHIPCEVCVDTADQLVERFYKK